MKHFIIPVALLLLFACTPAAPASNNTGNSSSSFSSLSATTSRLPIVSFFIPPKYDYVRSVPQGILTSGIFYSEVVVAEGKGESAQIRVMTTKDERIKQQLSLEFPLEMITVAGQQFQKYKQEGMGNTVGYIKETDGQFIVVSFDFPPSEEVILQVLESITAF